MRSESGVMLDPANLYRGMQRMIDDGLMCDGERRPAGDLAAAECGERSEGPARGAQDRAAWRVPRKLAHVT